MIFLSLWLDFWYFIGGGWELGRLKIDSSPRAKISELASRAGSFANRRRHAGGGKAHAEERELSGRGRRRARRAVCRINTRTARSRQPTTCIVPPKRLHSFSKLQNRPNKIFCVFFLAFSHETVQNSHDFPKIS